MDHYRDDFDTDMDSYPRRDPYKRSTRDRGYDYDRDMDYRPSYPPPSSSVLDDPFYRRLDDLEARILSRGPPPLPREPLGDPLLDPIRERDHAFDEPGALIHGSVIIVPHSPFDPKPKRRPKPPGCTTVFVGSLPENTTDKHVYDLFAKCGKITDVRLTTKRNFCHVQFTSDAEVEKAMELSGCRIRVGPSNSPSDVGRIHVDYAQDKAEVAFQRRIQECEMLDFTTPNVTQITTDLHREEAFEYAAKNIIRWFEKGECASETSNTFFTLINSVNNHCRRISKNMKSKEEDMAEFQLKRRKFFQGVNRDCKLLKDLFDTAFQQKSWSHFTKAQRRSLSQWKDHATDLHTQVKEVLGGNAESAGKPPPAKAMRLDSDSNYEADLERAKKEIDQLKTDHEVSMERKDRQILQLKTLLAKFKQSCPQEWEKAIGGSQPKAAGEAKVKKEKSQPLPPGEEDTATGGEASETIEGVNLDDLNAVMDDSSNSLAAAAAAYAQMRSSIGSTETSGLGLSEPEVAIVSVLAAFLTVHPLGSTIEEITTYFQGFNPSYNSYYLDSFLRRLPKVFQLTAGDSATPAKWWFLGFQTCYTAIVNQEEKPQGKKASESDD